MKEAMRNVRIGMLVTALFIGGLLIAESILSYLGKQQSVVPELTALGSQDGATIYRNNCLSCHGNTGLVFDGFHDKYTSEQALKDYIAAEMPKNRPGSLSDAEYTALASYVSGLNPKPQPPPQPTKRKLAIVGQRIWLDGNELRLTSQPQMVSGRLLVPFRPIFEAFQLKPAWNSKTRTITGSNSQTTIQLVINNRTALVNGKSVTLDTAPRIVNGATLVPIRFVAETLGLQVDYRAR